VVNIFGWNLYNLHINQATYRESAVKGQESK